MHAPRSRVEHLWLLVSLLALALPTRAHAQQSSRSSFPPLELRADAIDVRSTRFGTYQGGIGTNVPLGYYVRLEIDAAGGITKRDSVDHTSARIDAIARFLVDPFAETEWGLSIGGGLSAMLEESEPAREYLVVVVDLEGPRVAGIVPALQMGLGGGVRVGIIARAYRSGRR
ncbi:MAG TPA: hypothetical protein VH539_01475 [Gemmatimonadaceae bacterium]|jgi:hypothetical protein